MTARMIWLALACSLPTVAQPAVESWVQQFEKTAALQSDLALCMRITAAERLRVISPAASRRLLEGSFALLPKVAGAPNQLVNSLLNAYASQDLDAAEKRMDSVVDRPSAYAAMITQSCNQADFERGVRLSHAYLQEGHFALGAITDLLRRLQQRDPPAAALLTRDLVAGLQPEHATPADIRMLFVYLTQSQVEPAVAREAVRKAFKVLDRPGARMNTGSREYMVTYTLGGRKTQTTTSYDSALLATAAFQAVYDSDSFRDRKESLPEWGAALADLMTGDLPLLMQGPLLARDAGSAIPPSSRPQPRLPDVNALSFDQVLQKADPLAPAERVMTIWPLMKRKDLTPEQWTAFVQAVLRDADAINDLTLQHQMVRFAFGVVKDRQLEDPAVAAPEMLLAVLDRVVRSTDRTLVQENQRGVFAAEYGEIASYLDTRHIVLSKPDPAVEAARALRTLNTLNLVAEDFSLQTYDGKPFRLSEERGKVVVLDFWATWCGPCRESIPEVIRLKHDWSDRGVVVLGVDDEKPEVIRAFVDKNGMDYSTLVDPGKIHDLFGVTGIPAVIVIGRDGTLVDRVPFPLDQANFRSSLKKAGVQ